MPIKLLVSCPDRSDGTSFYRGYGPYSQLNTHPEIEISYVEHKILEWDDLIEIDVLFIQRPMTRYHLSSIKQAKKMNIPVIVDYDDYLFDLSDTNPAYKYYEKEESRYVVRECTKEADLVTVSTQHLADLLSKLNDNIAVVPNALDERFFEMTSIADRSKTILWRGGGSHLEDFDEYKKDITAMFNHKRFKDYTFVFMGDCPYWIPTVLTDSKRIVQYAFTDIFTYYQNLIDERPEFVIVPLRDNDFNRSKSNICAMEATYAGAMVIAPDFPEWQDQPNVINYKMGALLKTLLATEYKYTLVEKGIGGLPELSMINDLRYDLINKLSMNYTPANPKPIKVFNQKEFFDYEIGNGYCQDGKQYYDGYVKLCQYLKKDLSLKSVLDIGCGTGVIVELFNRIDVSCTGIDINHHHKDYFVKRNPDLEGAFVVDDITNAAFGEKFDLITCIEVFEHMTDKDLKKVIPKLAKNCKWFLFTSTPYRNSIAFDKMWGHINLKPVQHWEAIIEKYGFVLVKNMESPVPWAMLFKSRK